jgi:dolichol-phosphate mannosyltransferase
MSDDIYFVIPAYNEAENLPYLLKSICRVGRYFDLSPYAIIVDDASTDATPEVIDQYKEELNITLIHHEKNEGPGAAFQTGFKTILQKLNDHDIIITIEADNTSDLCVLGKMIELINRGYDVILANVYGSGKIVGADPIRRFISFLANLLMKIVFRIPNVDTFTSFFRAYRGKALKDLFINYGENAITEVGFTCMLEILLKFYLLGMSIGQAPMLLDSKIRIGESKMKVLRNMKATLAFMSRYLFQGQYRPLAKRSFQVIRGKNK